MKWELRAQKEGGEFGGTYLQGVVDRAAALSDECGGGFNCGFGLAPLQVECCVPSCFITCVQ